MYTEQITFSFVSLKIKVNRPIMKLDGKTSSVSVCGFFTIIQILSKIIRAFKFSLYHIGMQNLLNNLTIIKIP